MISYSLMPKSRKLIYIPGKKIGPKGLAPYLI